MSGGRLVISVAERDLHTGERTKLSVKILDVVSIDASESKLLEDGQEVANGTNGQEGERVGSFAEVGSSSGAEK